MRLPRIDTEMLMLYQMLIGKVKTSQNHLINLMLD